MYYHKKFRNVIRNLLICTIILLLSAWVLLPLYWMISTAVKPRNELYTPNLLPKEPTLKNFISVITGDEPSMILFLTQLMNSFKLAFISIVFTMLISIHAGYALSRLNFPLKNVTSRINLFTYLIPRAFLCIPFYIIMSWYGLINSLEAVSIPVTVFSAPYCIYVLREHFMSIPKEIEEAAKVDGASIPRILYTIILPLSLPQLIALTTFTFIRAWDEYLYVLIFISTEERMTVPIGLAALLNIEAAPWGLLMAASIIYTIPPVILYYMFEKYMVKGIMAGAIKG